MATNDDLPDGEVILIPNSQSGVYHVNPDCVSVQNGDSERRVTEEQAERWGYECCADCAREVDKSGEYGRQAASILKNADSLADAREQAQAQGD